MKQLKIILNNEHPLTRFHLLQLWIIDLFTKTLNNTSDGLNSLICEVCEPKESETIEETFTKITKLKSYIMDYNNKLKQTEKQIKHIQTYQNIINHLLEDNITEENKTIKHLPDDNKINHLIQINEKLINNIDKLSINDLKQIINQPNQ